MGWVNIKNKLPKLPPNTMGGLFLVATKKSKSQSLQVARFIPNVGDIVENKGFVSYPEMHPLDGTVIYWYQVHVPRLEVNPEELE